MTSPESPTTLTSWAASRAFEGLRVTVGTVIGLLAAGRSPEEILNAYPYLVQEDINQTLAYAAWRLEEREVPLTSE